MHDETRKRRALVFFEQVLGYELLPWQRTAVVDILATVNPRDKDKRLITESYIEIPKKNGKSFLSAGFGLYGLAGDGEEHAQVYIGASTREQAANVFAVCADLLDKSPHLRPLYRILRSTRTIISKANPNCYLKAISADAGNWDGINPHFAIYDELHRQKTRDLLDVFKFGQAARRNPLFFAITTAGIADESPVCWEYHERARQVLEGTLKQPHFYPVVYDMPPATDWMAEGEPGKWDAKRKTFTAPPTGWYAANPSLEGNPGGFLRLQALRDEAEEARRSPAAENSFRRFRLCQWVAQESRWIPLHEWDKCGEAFQAEELAGKACYGGLDLSTTLDLTAFVLAFEDGDDVKLLLWAWLPAEGLALREPADLLRWSKSGVLEATPGPVIDYAFIRQKINDLAAVYDIREIGHDPWNATQLATELESDGLTLVPIRQGFASLSPPSKAFEELVMSRRLRHGGNPLMRWAMDCCAVKQDPTGNIKPVKPDRNRSTKRIDPIVASIMAVDRLTRNQPKTSVYEERGLLTA